MTTNEQDRRLVGRLLSGDERAFNEFFAEYFERLRRFAFTRSGGREDLAEEAAQRALCRAVRRLDGFRGEASLFTWLAQICRNELADLLEIATRDGARLVSADSDDDARRSVERLAADEEPMDRAGERADVGAMVREVLEQLPGRYAEALELKYFEELATSDIALRLGMSFEAAQSLLQRARAAFKAALRDRGIDTGLLGVNG